MRNLSPVFWSLYIGLLESLSKAGEECYISSNKGDKLMTLSAVAICKMLNTCDSYANKYYTLLNDIKSRCLVLIFLHFLHENSKTRIFYAGNKPIKFVDSFLYLWYTITNKLVALDKILKPQN